MRRRWRRKSSTWQRHGVTLCAQLRLDEVRHVAGVLDVDGSKGSLTRIVAGLTHNAL
jgi:hypothetical protein